MAIPPMAAPAAEPAAPRGLFSRVFPVLRVILIWFAVKSVVEMFVTRPAATPPASPVVPSSAASMPPPATGERASPAASAAASASASASAPIAPSLTADTTFRNAFGVGESMSLRVYLSPHSHMSLAGLSDSEEQAQLHWHVPEIEYSTRGNPLSEDSQWTHEINLTVSDHLRHNGTLFAHVFLTKQGFSPNPEDAAFDPTATLYRRAELVTYRPRPKIVHRRNLLGGGEQTTDNEQDEEKESAIAPEEEEAVDPTTYISMWKPTLTLNVVFDSSVYTPVPGPPPFLHGHIEMLPKLGQYKPALYVNEFWLLEDHLVPINATVTTLPLSLKFYPLPLFKFALYTQMAVSFENQESMGTSSRRDTDSMKRMFLEANPYLLAVTLIVSVFHSLFDFLAFKNDVSFWRQQKSLAGLSIRSLMLNVFIRLISFLYLVDNDTSWLVLVSAFFSLVIEAWKITKAITVTRSSGGKIVWKHVESYAESPTAEHDRVAIEHLSMVLYPLLVGHAAYSLMYSEHKGWYSWGLSTLTSFVYLFGFIMMTPQLYINYKLKSVAHLPWRAMVYKSLNTFIDDLFAFVIKMPWLYRISCFRDDIIFFIQLYQRWIYPVDVARTNEFGQRLKQGGDGEETAALPDAAAATTTGADSDMAKALGEYRMKHRRGRAKQSKPADPASASASAASTSS